jgi:hypothetical protein
MNHIMKAFKEFHDADMAHESRRALWGHAIINCKPGDDGKLEQLAEQLKEKRAAWETVHPFSYYVVRSGGVPIARLYESDKEEAKPSFQLVQMIQSWIESWYSDPSASRLAIARDSRDIGRPEVAAWSQERL